MSCTSLDKLNTYYPLLSSCLTNFIILCLSRWSNGCLYFILLSHSLSYSLYLFESSHLVKIVCSSRWSLHPSWLLLLPSIFPASLHLPSSLIHYLPTCLSGMGDRSSIKYFRLGLSLKYFMLSGSGQHPHALGHLHCQLPWPQLHSDRTTLLTVGIWETLFVFGNPGHVNNHELRWSPLQPYDLQLRRQELAGWGMGPLRGTFGTSLVCTPHFEASHAFARGRDVVIALFCAATNFPHGHHCMPHSTHAQCRMPLC